MERLPVAVRELRLAARRPATYWLRCGAASMALVVAALFFWGTSEFRVLHEGRELLVFLSGIAFLFAVFGGGGSAAEAISSEVREGTLGFLFLTRLGSGDVLLGKLAACSLDAFYSLLSILPILGIPLLMGGVTGGDFLRMSACLVVTLFWSLSLCLLFSTFRIRRIEDSRVGAMALILLFTFVLPIVGVVLGNLLFVPPPAPAEWTTTPGYWLLLPFFLLSPGIAFLASVPGIPAPIDSLRLVPLATIAVSGVLFLAWTRRRLRNVWKDIPSPTPSTQSDRKSRNPIGFAPSVEYRTQVLDSAPLAWLALRRFTSRRGVHLLLVGLALTWAALFGYFGSSAFSQPPAWIFLSILLHLVLKGTVSLESARTLYEDRKSGAIEWLLSLPISNRDHVRQRLEAVARPHLPAIGAILVFDLAVATAFAREIDTDEDGLRVWILFWIYRTAFLVVDALALAYHGLWSAASTRSNKRPQWSFALVMGTPWLTAIVGTLVTRFSMEPTVGLSLYALGAIGWSSFVAFGARGNLEERFREVSVENLRPAKGPSNSE